MDYGAFYERMERELPTSTNFAASMSSLIDWLRQRVPHSDWNKLKELKFDEDLRIGKQWFQQLVKEHPSDFDTRALYFGISEEFGEETETGAYGPESADLYLVLFSEYDPNDASMDWIYGTNRFDFVEEQAKAHLPALKSIGLICNEEGSIGSDAYIALSVGFVVLLLKHILSGGASIAPNIAQPVAVVTGFGSGDLFKLGDLTKDRLRLSRAMISK